MSEAVIADEINGIGLDLPRRQRVDLEELSIWEQNSKD